MLWTTDGLCLLAGLGVVGGACLALFFEHPEECSGWRLWLLAPGLGAICGAVYLITDWMGPAGGGS